MVCHMKATDAQIAALEERFAERMGDTGIRLPAGAMQNREPGHIIEQGWQMGYLWDERDGEEFLELLVQNFAMDDVHVRWWASGREENLPPKRLGPASPGRVVFRGRRGQRLGRSKQPGNLCRTPRAGAAPTRG